MDEVNYIPKPVLADVNIMFAGTGDAVASQDKSCVDITGTISNGGVKVLEFVEPLPLNPDSKFRYYFLEPLVYVVSGTLSGLAVLHLEFAHAPRVTLSSPENQLIATTLGQHVYECFNGFRPEWDDMVFASFSPAIINQRIRQIDNLPWQVRKLLCPVPAVQCKKEHGLELLPAWKASPVCVGDAPVDFAENQLNLCGFVQLPFHASALAGSELCSLSAKSNWIAPSHFFRIAESLPEVGDSSASGITAVVVFNDGEYVAGDVRRVLARCIVPCNGIYSLPASSVCGERTSGEGFGLGVGLAIQKPAAEQVMNRGHFVDLGGNWNRILPSQQSLGLAVKDDLGVGLGVSFDAANPSLLASDPGVKPLAVFEQISHKSSNARYAPLLGAFGGGVNVLGNSQNCKPVPCVFPATGAFFFFRSEDLELATLIDNQWCAVATRKIYQNGSISAVACYAPAMRDPEKKFHGNKFRKLVEKECIHCKKTFWGRVDRDHEGRGKFCSVKCRWDHKRGTPHPAVGGMTLRAPSLQFRREAATTVRMMIRKGELVRPGSCEACGVECRPDAHHPDYHKPRMVVFLCKKCHAKAHRSSAFEKRVAALAHFARRDLPLSSIAGGAE